MRRQDFSFFMRTTTSYKTNLFRRRLRVDVKLLKRGRSLSRIQGGICRVDDAFDRISDFILRREHLPQCGSVELVNDLDLVRTFLFPPMSALGIPRITTTCRLKIEDPNGHDEDNYKGTVDFREAYTLGLTQEGFTHHIIFLDQIYWDLIGRSEILMTYGPWWINILRWDRLDGCVNGVESNIFPACTVE